MATNQTARTAMQLEADGERLCDGLRDHGEVIGMLINPEPRVRAALQALKSASSAFGQAQSDETKASQAAQAADDANAAFIAQFVHWMCMVLGGEWSNRWIETGLPDHVVGVPRSVAKRFVALNGIAAFLTNHPEHELTHLHGTITAAKAHELYERYSDLRSAANAKRGAAKAAKLARDAAFKAFRKRFISSARELRQQLSAGDPRWYLFGLRPPADPQTPDAPRGVTAEVAAPGCALVKTRGSRRARSLNFYRKIAGADAEPVKVGNFRAKEFVFRDLPVGATVEFTMTGVNDAGESRPSAPVAVVVR